MNKTKRSEGVPQLALDTLQLAESLGCGKGTAITIGMEAKARIQIGKRVLWNAGKVKMYLDTISE